MLPQAQNDKLFQIKSVVENSEMVRQIVFGIAQHVDSSSVLMRIDQLHQRIK